MGMAIRYLSEAQMETAKTFGNHFNGGADGGEIQIPRSCGEP